MKIIRLTSLCAEFDADIHPDSAMILPGRPLFMPEEGDGWVAGLYLAARISRLGKNVARKFAPRYYDGVTAALRVGMPDGACDFPEGLLSGMDSSVVHGDWQDAEALKSVISVSLGAPLKWSCPENRVEFAPMAEAVDAAIARVSGYMTLKMGDMLMLPLCAANVGADKVVADCQDSCTPIEISLQEQTHVTLGLNGNTVLDLKVV